MDIRRTKIQKSTLLFWSIITLLLILSPAEIRASQTLPLSAQYRISKAMGKDQAQYHAKAKELEVILENRSQNFMAELHDDAGLEIQHQGHHIRVRFISFGYGNDVRQVQAARPHYSTNQISYNHGLIRQWFVNGPMGLQQGFTIDRRPEHISSHNFTLALHVDSDLYPSMNGDEHGVSFVGKNGIPVFKYSGLMVVDARNQQLPAHMEMGNNQIAVVVDDYNAVYPIIVDPIFQQVKLTSDDGAAGDNFAQSLAIEGDTIVIGAPEYNNGSHLHQGIVYVFEKIAGHWTQTAQLTAHDGQYGSRLGKAVAIDHDVIVAGAPGQNGRGAAYIFVKPPSGWSNMTDTASLTSYFGRIGDWFGYSVDINNDTVAVGAMLHDVAGKSDQGEACVFVKPANGWRDKTEDRILKAQNGEANEYFGRSVAIDNDTIIVGSDAHGSGGQSFQGAVYVFEKPSSGWPGAIDLTQTAKLMASDGAEYDYLGYSVDIDGNTIVAGAPGFHSIGQLNLGAAYVFVRSGTHWIDMEETAELRARDAMTGDYFGHSVAIEGNTIVVGSPYHNYSGTAYNGMPFFVPNMGAVYSFTKPVNGWPWDMRAKAEMRSNDGHTEDHLGSSVDISGQTVIAGAPDHDTNGNDDQGSAYVFRLKKHSPWPMFVSAITSRVGHVIAGNQRVNAPDPSNNTTRYKKYIGIMTLGYANTMIPHFNESTDSFCTLWMPINGNIGPLTCSPEVLYFDATEIDGNAKLRYKGSIHFQPTGTCNKSLNTCSVADGASGNITEWWWTWNGTSWDPLPGTPWTGTLDGFGNIYNFELSKIISVGETLYSGWTENVSWKLWLMEAP